MAKRKLSHSGREDYKSCARKFYLGRELKLEPLEKKHSLRMGSAFAKMLEHGAATDEVALDGFTEHMTAGQKAEYVASPLDKLEMAQARLLAELYLQRYEPHDSKFVAQHEVEFTSPVVGPGKLDGVLTLYRNGNFEPVRREGVECKLFTKGMFWNDTSIKVLAIDDQVTAYFYAMREAGTPLDHLRYRVTFKPGIKPDSRKVYKETGRKGERLEDYLARLRARIEAEPEYAFEEHILYRTDDELDMFGEEAAEVNAHVALSRRRKAWPKNTKSCTMFGGCAFLPLCRNEPGAATEYRVRKAPIKLTKPQRRVLRALGDAFTGAVVPSMLAKQAMTTGAGLAKTLTALEGKGLVAALMSDGVLLYELTDAGKEAMSK